MQLSAISKIDGNPSMVVDYYPVMLSTGYHCENHMLKVVSFKGIQTVSKKIITKKEFHRECDERIGMGYQVTDFHTEYQIGNPMAGAC